MLYLRTVPLHLALEQVGLQWQQPLPGLADAGKPAWQLVTMVRDEAVELKDSKFFKSLRNCDDKKKKASLVQMVVALKHATQFQDYQAAIKGLPGIFVKPAHGFNFRGKAEKIWELKYQKKDRLYFFSYQNNQAGSLPQLVLLQFEHKKDQETPQDVCESCETVMKLFLEPTAKTKTL